MRIINVVVLISGLIDQITSFPIINDEAELSQIKQAESFFIQCIEDANPSIKYREQEKELFILATFWVYGNHEVLLTWSDVKL